MLRRTQRLLALAAACCCCIAAAAPAYAQPVTTDEVKAALDKAVVLFSQNKVGEMERLLNETLQKIRESRRLGLRKFLPAPPEGYKAELIETPPPPEFLSGLGQQADVVFTKDSGPRVAVSLMLDSPLNEQYREFIGSDEFKKVPSLAVSTHQGYQSIERSDTAANEVTLLLSPFLMVVVRGEKTDMAEVKRILDTVKLKELLAEYSPK